MPITEVAPPEAPADCPLCPRLVAYRAANRISVPGGFTASGLPVGVQIVGRHRDDWSVLQLAHAFEQATRHGERRPEL